MNNGNSGRKLPEYRFDTPPEKPRSKWPKYIILLIAGILVGAVCFILVVNLLDKDDKKKRKETQSEVIKELKTEEDGSAKIGSETLGFMTVKDFKYSEELSNEMKERYADAAVYDKDNLDGTHSDIYLINLGPNDAPIKDTATDIGLYFGGTGDIKYAGEITGFNSASYETMNVEEDNMFLAVTIFTFRGNDDCCRAIILKGPATDGETSTAYSSYELDCGVKDMDKDELISLTSVNFNDEPNTEMPTETE